MDDDNLDFNPDDFDKPIVPDRGSRNGSRKTFSTSSSRQRASKQPSADRRHDRVSLPPPRRSVFGDFPKQASSQSLGSSFLSREASRSHREESSVSTKAGSLSESSRCSTNSTTTKSSSLGTSRTSSTIKSTRNSQISSSSNDSGTTITKSDSNSSPHHASKGSKSSELNSRGSSPSSRGEGRDEESNSTEFLFTKPAPRPPTQQYRSDTSSSASSTPQSTTSSLTSLTISNRALTSFSQESHRSSVSSITHTSISTKGSPAASLDSKVIPTATHASVSSRVGDVGGLQPESRSSMSRRKASRHRVDWLNGDDEDDDDLTVKSFKTSAFATAAVRDTASVTASDALMNKNVFPVARAAVGRTDVYAVADSGNTQFFRDEVLWCCSNIVGSNKKERLQASIDLALLVSDTATYTPEAIVHADLLTALLNVIAFCKTLVIEEESLTNEESGGGDESSVEVKRFVAIVLHYLAMACCDDQSTGSKRKLRSNDSLRQSLRQSFLSSPDALQGITYLILADPRLTQIRGKKRNLHNLVVANLEHGPISTTDPSTPLSTVSSSAASTPESSQSSSVVSPTNAGADIDPTRAGRMKRVKRRRVENDAYGRLSPIPEDRKPPAKKTLVLDNDDEMSFLGDTKDKKRGEVGDGKGKKRGGVDDNLSFKDDGSSEGKSKVQKKVVTLLRRVAKTLGDFQNDHTCATESDVWTESLPLLALTRIVTGKLDGNAHALSTSTSSEIEASTFSGPRNDGDADIGLHNDDDEDVWNGKRESQEVDNKNESSLDENPLLMGNRRLAESGIVSLLATAVADTMMAVLRMLNRDCRKRRRHKIVCLGCVSHLHERFRLLVSIVDGACLFSSGNRVMFCQSGFSSELGGYLIVGLVSVLNRFFDSSKLFGGVWGDIVMETLRTLLSLTHENKVAARELETLLHGDTGSTCLHVLTEVLYASTKDDDLHGDRHKYDCAIFCLNILTNYLESGGSRQKLAEIQLLNGRKNGTSEGLNFLTWVSAFSVAETQSFRDAVMESTFGSSPSKHSARTLQGNEDEKLVIAGNGFVLLAWLLVGNSNDESVVRFSQIRDRIEAELPGADSPSKMTYLRNTLKAFCNFYHVSVGDLSVVIVDPVKKLIWQLERLIVPPSSSQKVEGDLQLAVVDLTE